MGWFSYTFAAGALCVKCAHTGKATGTALFTLNYTLRKIMIKPKVTIITDSCWRVEVGHIAVAMLIKSMVDVVNVCIC